MKEKRARLEKISASRHFLSFFQLEAREGERIYQHPGAGGFDDY